MQSNQTAQQPHRPGPLHQTNKAHKGDRHARKSSARYEIKNKTIAKPLSKISREGRLNQASQDRKAKFERAIEEKRKLGTENQPPLLIGVLDLHLNSGEQFFSGLKACGEDDSVRVELISSRGAYIILNKLKMRFKFVVLDAGNSDETLDIVKTLDIMLLIHHPKEVEVEHEKSTERLLRMIRIHCLPTTIHVIQADFGGDNQSNKVMMNAKKILKAKANDDKIHTIEQLRDYGQLFHIIGNCRRQKSHFKESRPTIVPDAVEIINGAITFMGFVRNRILSPDSLIHVVGFDDYQIKQIDLMTDALSFKSKSGDTPFVEQTLNPNPMSQETLDQENELDPMEGEQTWPTAEELAAEVERRNTKRVVKKLPAGTSEYQGAWIPEESDEEQFSSCEDDDHDAKMREIAEESSQESADDSGDEDSTSAKEEDDNGVSNMDVDDYDKKVSNEKELKILEKIKEARMEEMFPDEVDTPMDMPARVRFARYRGLKSFRTSPWDPQENLPPDYSRIFQFQNFNLTRRRVMSESYDRGAHPGQYVRVHLVNVPEQVVMSIISRGVTPNLVGILKHERKMTVMNYLIKRTAGDNSNIPIKSKDELIFYVGFRKFKARPLFTTHSVSSKFKYERFLRDDVAMVATVYAPVTFPPAPVLVFRTNYKGEKELVASGSVLDSNPNRLIIKRIRLSGHPFKIHSKTAVIRFMFFNGEDVMYFKPVELSTKFNRRGHISEALGTHGHMKCTFDRKIRSDDCILMNLYKRVFPKWNYIPLLSLN